MTPKIKVIVGFRKDQHHTIDAEEAHKAYYLFLHPDERGIFKNGLALRGADIQKIEPDYNATMGWNPTHTLDEDDWNEIRKFGADEQLRNVMYDAVTVAQLGEPKLLALPLSEAAVKSLNHGNNQIQK